MSARFVDFMECPVCSLAKGKIVKTRYYTYAPDNRRTRIMFCEVCKVARVQLRIGTEWV